MRCYKPYLYDQRQGAYLCLSRSTPLVRYPEIAQPIQPLKITPPLRILAMIASPDSPATPKLDTERERERMREALKDLEDDGLVKLDWLKGQTWRHLLHAMQHGPWHIFYFIGHGGFDRSGGEGVLAFENDQGGLHLLSATQLGILLADHNALRLVILNACEGAKGDSRDLFSSTAATLARRGIPGVLAMQYEISDNAAIECTRTFYESLADGLPVEGALASARTAIYIGVNNSLEWGTPVLYMRVADGLLFDWTDISHKAGEPQPKQGNDPGKIGNEQVKADAPPVVTQVASNEGARMTTVPVPPVVPAADKTEEVKPRRSIKTFTELLEMAPADLRALFETIKGFLLGLGDDVQMKQLNNYIAFRRIKNFACVEVLPAARHIIIFAKADFTGISLEKSFTRDVHGIGHYGTGDLEITIRSNEDFERAKPLLLRSYEIS